MDPAQNSLRSINELVTSFQSLRASLEELSSAPLKMANIWQETAERLESLYAEEKPPEVCALLGRVQLNSVLLCLDTVLERLNGSGSEEIERFREDCMKAYEWLGYKNMLGLSMKAQISDDLDSILASCSSADEVFDALTGVSVTDVFSVLEQVEDFKNPDLISKLFHLVHDYDLEKSTDLNALSDLAERLRRSGALEEAEEPSAAVPILRSDARRRLAADYLGEWVVEADLWKRFLGLCVSKDPYSYEVELEEIPELMLLCDTWKIRPLVTALATQLLRRAGELEQGSVSLATIETLAALDGAEILERFRAKLTQSMGSWIKGYLDEIKLGESADEAGKSSVPTIYKLSSLDFRRCEFSRCAGGLREMELRWLPAGESLGDAELDELTQGHPSLTHISFASDSITDSGIDTLLRNCPNLQSIKMIACHGITNWSVEAISSQLADSLEEISVSGCRALTDVSLASLGQRATKLASADFSLCPRISHWGIQPLLRGAASLRHLNLRACLGIGDAAIEAIVNHGGKLQSLDIRNCISISDKYLSGFVRKGSQIETLKLTGCIKVSDCGLAGLIQNFECLKHLDIGGNSKGVGLQVSLDGLKDVAEHSSRLRSLSVTGHRLDEEFFTKLAENATNLEKLDLSYCEGLKEKMVRDLSKALPKLRTIVLSNSNIVHAGARVHYGLA